MNLLNILLCLVFCFFKNSLAQVSAANSLVTGDAVSNFEALSVRTVTVTARDAGSTNIGSGGDLFYVQISNQCTKASNFECTVGGGADNTISTPIFTMMTDNNDGTYTYSWTPDNEGTLSIVPILFNRFSILSTFYHTADLTGAVASTNYSSTINYNWTTYNVTATQSDTVSAKFEGYIQAPVTGSIVLYMYTEDYAALWVDGTLQFNHMSTVAATEYTATITTTQDNFYRIEAHWGETTGEAVVRLYWSYSGQAKQIIPATHWFYPEYIASAPYTVTVSCPSGYTGTNTSNPNVCSEICGDSKKVGNEVCDDGDTLNTNGCASDCRSINAGWVCTGGNPTTADTCTQCTSGYYQNDAANPTTCVSRCGDGFEVGTENCDDGNTINGDGCKGDCTSVEAGWVCSGGSATASDTCTKCADGFHQDNAANPTTCVTQCGDGFEAGTEQCDDGNTAALDGCAADCTTVEAGWVCIGGSPTSSDTCTQCAAGYVQNNAANPETCVTVCGDSLEAGTEKCDDGNTVANDGCAADCSTVEAGWVCIGGSPTTIDVCTQCAAGFYQDSSTNPQNCVTRCGDGLRAGTEVCDDGNTVSGDGCANDCGSIEASWACDGGTPTSIDVCTFCDTGFLVNNLANPTSCVSICGDGRKLSDELCDDGNFRNGDGCDSTCTPETDYICEGGNFTQADTCKTCHLNYKPDGYHRKCVPKDMDNTIITFSSIFFGFIFAGIFFSILTVMTSSNSYQSMFSMINQVQIFLLLPLIGTFRSEEINDFCRFMDIFSGGFSWITKYIIPIAFEPIEEYDYAQKHWYLYLLEIESGSTLYNLSGPVFVIFSLCMLHSFAYILNDLSVEKKDDSKYFRSLYKLIRWLNFGAYIRLFLFSFMFICISSIYEMKKTENRSSHSTPYTFAVLSVIILTCTNIAMGVYLWTLKSDPESKGQMYTRELTLMFKDSKWSRVFYAVFCLRRFLLVFSLLGLENLDPKIKLFLFTTIEFFYISYCFVVRPFKKVKDNISEIYNQGTLITLLIFMIIKMGKEDWGSIENNIFLVAIMANAVVNSSLSIVGFLEGLMSDLDKRDQQIERKETKKPEPIIVREFKPNHNVRQESEESANDRVLDNRTLHHNRTTAELNANGSVQNIQPMSRNEFKNKGIDPYNVY